MGANEHKKFSSVGSIQKGVNLLDIGWDLRYVEGWKYEDKGCKMATCDDLLKKEDSEKDNKILKFDMEMA